MRCMFSAGSDVKVGISGNDIVGAGTVGNDVEAAGTFGGGSWAVSTRSRSINSSLLPVVERLRRCSSVFIICTFRVARSSAVATRQLMKGIVVDGLGRVGLGGG